jgi:hypothetical protein
MRFCAGCGRDYLGGYCEVCGARARRARLRHKIRTCIVCNTDFTTTRTDPRFCSNACRQKNYRVTESHGLPENPRLAVTAR